jgi:hypothetical protein
MSGLKTNKRTNFLDLYRKAYIGGSISINDLRDRELEGQALSPKEQKALRNFDRFRIIELNSQPSEEAFHQKYMQLQIMANLIPFDEFLRDEYEA